MEGNEYRSGSAAAPLPPASVSLFGTLESGPPGPHREAARQKRPRSPRPLPDAFERELATLKMNNESKRRAIEAKRRVQSKEDGLKSFVNRIKRIQLETNYCRRSGDFSKVRPPSAKKPDSQTLPEYTDLYQRLEAVRSKIDVVTTDTIREEATTKQLHILESNNVKMIVG